MPVMVKLNVATECCITNGAEAYVQNWHSYLNSENKEVLEILFVRLKNPPRNINLPGLPENVVPIVPVSNPVTCKLPNDATVQIARSQVPVLPNFSMTGYCSQGRTRLQNICHLHSSQYTLASYYTSLSRSASADDTIIIQDFDTSYLTNGIPGYLRQEYRELEILDHITELRFEGKLPATVTGSHRNSLVRSYREHFGRNHVPKQSHPSLKWNGGTNFEPHEIHTFEEAATHKRKFEESDVYDQQPTNKQKLSHTKGAKRPPPPSTVAPPSKRSKTDDTLQPLMTLRYPGFIWDKFNWSCAYDALLFIVMSTWSEQSSLWRNNFKDMNQYTSMLSVGFGEAQGGISTYEEVRDRLRGMLYAKNRRMFPKSGPRLTGISDVILEVLASQTHSNPIIHTQKCDACLSTRTQHIDPNLLLHLEYYRGLTMDTWGECTSTRQWLSSALKGPDDCKCDFCGTDISSARRIRTPPLFIRFDVSHTEEDVHLSKRISWRTTLADAQSYTYHLKGVIYLGHEHFTSRFISQDKEIWNHDGVTSGRDSVNATSSTFNLLTLGDSDACIAIYARR